MLIEMLYIHVYLYRLSRHLSLPDVLPSMCDFHIHVWGSSVHMFVQIKARAFVLAIFYYLLC